MLVVYDYSYHRIILLLLSSISSSSSSFSNNNNGDKERYTTVKYAINPSVANGMFVYGIVEYGPVSTD